MSALDRRRRAAHVGTSSAAGRPAPASMSARALLEPARVLVAQLARRRALQPPHHAVRVAGEVGQHVADAPAGQAARPARHRVGQAGQVGVAARPGRPRTRRPGRSVRGRRPARHVAGMVDCPSSMSAMTARMNSSASSVMPPATPP